VFVHTMILIFLWLGGVTSECMKIGQFRVFWPHNRDMLVRSGWNLAWKVDSNSSVGEWVWVLQWLDAVREFWWWCRLTVCGVFLQGSVVHVEDQQKVPSALLDHSAFTQYNTAVAVKKMMVK